MRAGPVKVDRSHSDWLRFLRSTTFGISRFDIGLSSAAPSEIENQHLDVERVNMSMFRDGLKGSVLMLCWFA